MRNRLELEIEKIGEYLGCNSGELIIEMRKVLQNTKISDLDKFIHE